MSNSNLKKSKQAEEEQLDVADYIERFAQWTEKNAKTIIFGFLAFTLVTVAFWGVSAMQTRALNVAAHETGVVNRRIDLLEKAVSEAKNKETAEFEANKKAEISNIHVEALKAVEAHSDKSVTDFTAVRWAAYLVSEKEEAMALEVLSKAKPDGSRELSAAGLFLKASIYTTQAKLADAVSLYDSILAEPKWEVFHAEALIQKGSLLESEGKVEEAIALFDQAKTLKKDSGFSKDAAKYLRLLQLKKNNPEVFSKTSNLEG